VSRVADCPAISAFADGLFGGVWSAANEGIKGGDAIRTGVRE
jgi:hypothetical protein